MAVSEHNQQKVIETKRLLLDIINDPKKFDHVSSIKLALKSQMALAKFHDKSFGICACSLNTMKSASEQLLERGFIELDELRVNAKEAITMAAEAPKVNKSTRARLRHKVEQLEEQLNTVKQSNFLLTALINELRSELKKMTFTEASLRERKDKYMQTNRNVEAKLNYLLERDT